MGLLGTALLLAIIAAIIDAVIGIKDPWRKIIYVGVLVLFVVGLIIFLFGWPLGRGVL